MSDQGPNACAAFQGIAQFNSPEMQEYIQKINLQQQMSRATWIVWATRGNLVPEDIRNGYIKQADILKYISREG